MRVLVACLQFILFESDFGVKYTALSTVLLARVVLIVKVVVQRPARGSTAAVDSRLDTSYTLL